MDEKYGIQTKEYMLAELKELLNSTPHFVVTNYRGVTALQLDKLRKGLLKSSSKYFVVKNSLAKRAFGEMNLQGIDEFMKGEIGIGFIGDLIKGSKTIVDFSKEHSALKLNCAVIDGRIENADKVKDIAALPPREVLLAMVFSCMKNPITSFVGVLNSLLRNLVCAINEIKKKKEGGEQK